MAIKVVDAASVLRTALTAKVMDGSGLRSLKSVKVLAADGVTLNTVANFVSAMTASVTPISASAYAVTADMTTNALTVTPSGGLAPYTYAWTRTLGISTINSPTSATTTFTETGMASEETRESNLQCVVTDAIGQTATITTSAFFFRYSIL